MRTTWMREEAVCNGQIQGLFGELIRDKVSRRGKGGNPEFGFRC